MGPGGGPPTGVGNEAKSYRHKLLIWAKKVVTGQSQNAKKTCFKSSTPNDEKDIYGHVAIVA
jgi:hypothetical protein